MNDTQIRSALDQRPNFGKKQIRCQNQIHKGQAIRIRSTGGYNQLIKIIRGPYKENGHLRIDFEFQKNEASWVGSILLEDHSVIRDSKKEWNRWNWLEKA